ncbi:MAG: hypothetical protein ABI459_04750 [Deltaproteobacteria bacterium]
MKLSILSVLAVASLAACVEPTTDTKPSGVGFNDYQNYSASQLARQADDRRRMEGGAPVMTAQPQPLPNDRVDVSAIATAQPVPQQPLPVATQPVQPVQPVMAAGSNAKISDENDFSAVASRETIESDAARIAANKAAYTEVQPTALPDRPAGDAATIVEYALSTTNSVGQSVYKRSGVFAQSRFDKGCAKFPSQDKAQEAFLNAGGPKRDSKGIDPDGDGFACYWDPAPFRSAKMGATMAQPVVPVNQ